MGLLVLTLFQSMQGDYHAHINHYTTDPTSVGAFIIAATAFGLVLGISFKILYWLIDNLFND